MAERVAIVGLGRMGAAMAGTLSRGGFDLVVYNRSADKAQAVAEATGADVAATAREAAAAAPIVLSTLSDDRAVTSVYLDADGLVEGIGDGTVVLEMSTVDPQTVHDLRPAVEQQGGTLMDAPVSGSVNLVEQGALTIMAGGDAEALERVRPVLDPLAARIFHVGDVGAGATMKLAVNGIVHAINVAVCEGLVLAEQSGIERARAYEVFMASAGGAPFVHYKQAAFEDPESSPVAFSLALSAKDLDLITGLADRLGVSMGQAVANRTVAHDAVDAGLGERDMSVIAEYLRTLAESKRS
jgi:3-hydroxyisobutyrate dehydrogenase-like beta-hydroxyacid dehydrogenase